MSLSSGMCEARAAGAPGIQAFQGIHRGETIVVCGCGESLNDLAHPDRYVTIGVNDVGRRFDPTYLVVVNPRSQFSADRFRYIERSRAQYVFTQLDLRLPRDGVVKFGLGRYGGTTFTEPGVLHYTRNSPYVAMCLAVQMGATRIGVIGVDFTDRHFFGGTGRHPLADHLPGIDAEYRRLAEALARLGVTVVNLSRISRLTAFPRAAESDDAAEATNATSTTRTRRARIFAVTYRFLSCGDVFSDGLRRAAAALDVDWADAAWDDPRLPTRVAAFAPDLLFVVHGRRFVQRWRNAFSTYRTAVWLLDEPYEVDDTAAFSRAFGHVFVNDPATVGRHRGAHYLPACHDPVVHRPEGAERPHDVGFIGGANPTRERLLSALARRGLLSYVVGGPWGDPSLAPLTRASRVPAAETAVLYRSTRIVVNVFRDRHHFNRTGVSATSMNPRIHEALACGALVISEPRPEIASAVPELPVFHDEAGLVSLVEHYLARPDELAATQAACAARLKSATYADRLRTVIALALDGSAEDRAEAPPGGGAAVPDSGPLRGGAGDGAEWELLGPVACHREGEEIELRAVLPWAPGSERGLVTTRPRSDITLSFEARLPPDACLVAKIHQAEQANQCANSYHLYCDAGSAYVARHHCVFRTFDLPPDVWIRLQLAYSRGVLSVSESGRVIHTVRDALLPGGYAVLSVKRGAVRLRRIALAHAADPVPADLPGAEGEVLVPGDTTLQPRVSIVTTVYDRVECLRQCIRTVRRQRFTECEHIIVSDCPGREVVERIASLVRSFGDGRLSYMNLPERHNDWGIAPAAAGLRRTRGRYVSFLSDDNGYTPEHVGTLVAALDADPGLGFAYSSCRYAGRLVLRHPVPAPARIDLGQPMFRRELFSAHLADDLPFQMMAWDWAMIDSFVQRGVRWKHVDVPSFIFRLARYPQLMVRP